MIYKIVKGAPIECHTSVQTEDPPFYTETAGMVSLDVYRVATPGEVILFRARLADRPFTLVAETTLEVAESMHYLKGLGLSLNIHQAATVRSRHLKENHLASK